MKQNSSFNNVAEVKLGVLPNFGPYSSSQDSTVSVQADVTNFGSSGLPNGLLTVAAFVCFDTFFWLDTLDFIVNPVSEGNKLCR